MGLSGDDAGKAYHERSVFIAENLLREALARTRSRWKLQPFTPTPRPASAGWCALPAS